MSERGSIPTGEPLPIKYAQMMDGYTTPSIMNSLNGNDLPPHEDKDVPYSAAEIEAHFWEIIIMEEV